MIWFLHGDLLSSARHALFQQSSHKFTAATTDAGNTIGAPGGRPLVSVEAFVTEIYRAYLARRDRQRPLVEGGRQLVERICCLFDLVDIDSTGTIDWEDFTDFCVYMRGGGEGNRGPGDTDGVGDMSPGRTFDNKDGDITLFTERLGYTDRSSHCHEVCPLYLPRDRKRTSDLTASTKFRAALLPLTSQRHRHATAYTVR